jgi:hypothetical protein
VLLRALLSARHSKKKETIMLSTMSNATTINKLALVPMLTNTSSTASSTAAAATTKTARLSPQDILKKPPFAPTNVNLFAPQTYSTASVMKPAPAKSVSESQLKSQLCKTLLERLKGDCYTTRKTVNLMSDSKLKKVVPDARLRAGLLSLKGTAGQSAIDAIRNGTYSSVKFGTPPSGPNTIAEVVPPPIGQTKPGIIINSKYQYEDFRLFGPILAHEAMHQDPANGGKEELIANVIDTTIYGQTVVTDPQLATSGTELSRRLNTKLMARINSRDTNGNLRILSAQGNVYPGGTPLTNFAAAFNTSGPDTPGNATMRKELQAVTGTPLGNINFNNSTITLLDNHQKALSVKEIVQLAKTLKLNVSS